jgi:hypothetical protein
MIVMMGNEMNIDMSVCAISPEAGVGKAAAVTCCWTAVFNPSIRVPTTDTSDSANGENREKVGVCNIFCHLPNPRSPKRLLVGDV